MRIAAGVLLIIAGIMNLFAGLGYLGGGAVAASSGALVEAAAEQAAKDNPNMTAEQKAEMEKSLAEAKKATEGASAAGGGLMIFGIFLIIMLGLQIAGAVVLFQQKAATFALVVGVLSLVAEGGGIAMVGFTIFQVVGLIGGVLAILAARSYKTA